uniref:Uncharacterized protein n=1 Tax=Nelumbo nucifera TaxID=4432 RepID=A0A822Y5R7_NELNU|nr:TPA_asm: hypothetical protein HUJ06_028439 [Nelumbo nucifera]
MDVAVSDPNSYKIEVDTYVNGGSMLSVTNPKKKKKKDGRKKSSDHTNQFLLFIPIIGAAFLEYYKLIQVVKDAYLLI